MVISRPITDLDNVWLTTMSMNASAVHLDAARAADGPFGSTILAGVITVAIAAGLASQNVPSEFGSPIGWDSIRLLGPVRVGDAIQVETEVIDPGSRAESGVQRVRTKAYLDDKRLVAELITLYQVPEEEVFPNA